MKTSCPTPDGSGSAETEKSWYWPGRIFPPFQVTSDTAVANEPSLAKVARWPVTISYFDKGKKAESKEQTPAYAIGFELYENGISRALSLDYNDFLVSGKLTTLEIKKPKPCP